VLALIAPLLEGSALASCGMMQVDATDASLVVKAWARAWMLNPYFAHGKFGGLFALSPIGVGRVFPLPLITGDDEWIRRAFVPGEVAFVAACRFVARAPRSLNSLIQTRCRILRGARAVSAMGRAKPMHEGAQHMLRAGLAQPRRWPDLLVFVAIMAWVRLRLATERSAPRWERDQTTRPTLPDIV
jgi:hypothetical protein